MKDVSLFLYVAGLQHSVDFIVNDFTLTRYHHTKDNDDAMTTITTLNDS
jgi:hypothetical protein